MKAIDFAQGLKKKLTNNLAPISKGEINLLVDMLYAWVDPRLRTRYR